jgi:chemotaxis signal transduction protein
MLSCENIARDGSNEDFDTQPYPYKAIDKMEFDFYLLTTFLLERQGNEQIHIRCLGSREILKLDRDAPRYVLGTIEFESSHIPVVDPGAASGSEPIRIDHSTCILIVEHNYDSRRLYTGVLVQGFEEIEKLAAGIYKLGSQLDASENVRIVLEMHSSNDIRNQILLESHRMLSLLDEPGAENILKGSGPRSGKLFNRIDKLKILDLPKRHIVLEELASRPELWDEGRNVMVL